MLPLLVPRGARACSCRRPSPPEVALDEADVVFEARPFAMTTDGQRAHYGFEVDRVWKGGVGPRAEISTALHSASCGRSYQIGTKYVVYATQSQNGGWQDNLCSRTRPSASAAEDLEVLGPGADPRPRDAAPVVAGADTEPTEPPRIEPVPVQPPPTAPSRRGCAMEKPHGPAGPAALALLGLAVAIGRRRTVRSPAPRREPSQRTR